MPHYCVNRRSRSNGEHEVHNLDSGCPYLPDILNQIPLGHHETCATALQAACLLFDTANGCYNCATECHADPEARHGWAARVLED